jgi:flagellin
VTRVAAAEWGSATIASGASFALAGAATLKISGELGTALVTLASGATLDQIRTVVNEYTGQTGVSAYVGPGSKLNLTSTGYGSDAFVSVTRLAGSAGLVDSAHDDGKDALVTINGQTTAVDGLNVHYSFNGLSLSFSLSTAFNQSGGMTSFVVSDRGGATFQLGGDLNARATIGVDSLHSQRLGNSALGFLDALRSGGGADLLSDPGKAVHIARAAARQVAGVQARLGAFQKYQIEPILNQQTAMSAGITAALSAIRDLDFAAETAELNRHTVLLQSGISLLGLMNQRAAQVLKLLE